MPESWVCGQRTQHLFAKDIAVDRGQAHCRLSVQVRASWNEDKKPR